MLQGSWCPHIYIFSASDAWCAISQSVSAAFQATEKWKLHDTANVWHVRRLECFNCWINAEEMLISCQADHNKHAINKTDRLTDCNFMTDYTVTIYKSYKGENCFTFCFVHKIYLYERTNSTYTEEWEAAHSAQVAPLLLSDHKNKPRHINKIYLMMLIQNMNDCFNVIIETLSC